MEITTAIVKQLQTLGLDTDIICERPSEAFKEATFYLYEAEATIKKELMGRQTRKHTYTMLFFPDKQENIDEQYTRMRELFFLHFNCLDTLAIGITEKVMKSEENGMRFTFTVQYRMGEVTDQPQIKQIEQRGGLKND